jgi:hypothetical protein
VDTWAVWALPTLGAFVVEAGVALLAAGALWLVWRLRDADAIVQPLPSVAPPAAAALTPAELSPEELARRAEASRYE